MVRRRVVEAVTQVAVYEIRWHVAAMRVLKKSKAESAVRGGSTARGER
jgi:hypothetical protein